MKQIPQHLTKYKETPRFSEKTVPAGLLKDHSTKQGVWGKIVVVKGLLRYVIQTSVVEAVELSPQQFGVVEPEILHFVEPLGPVEFYVEFYR